MFTFEQEYRRGPRLEGLRPQYSTNTGSFDRIPSISY